MKCSIYIACSADGFIATNDDNIDWLHTAGKPNVGMGNEILEMNDYMATVDCMIMGRKCMEKIESFNLTDEQWPYGDTRIIVLSNTVKEPPESLKNKVEMHSGDLKELIHSLEKEGHKHAYIDGGMTIQSFINLKLINEMTITIIPILLGEGKPLFGKTYKKIKLENATAIAGPNDFIQVHYTVNYN